MNAEHVATQQESLKPHLVEPLLTTLVRRHLSDASILDLAVVLASKTPLKVSQSIRRVRCRLSSLCRSYSQLSLTDSCKTSFSTNISSWSAGGTVVHPKGIKRRVYSMCSSGSILQTPVNPPTLSRSFKSTGERCHRPTDGSSLS